MTEETEKKVADDDEVTEGEITVQSTKKKSNVKTIAIVAIAITLVIAGIVGLQGSKKYDTPEAALNAYIEALNRNDYAKALSLVQDTGDITVDNVLNFANFEIPELEILGSEKNNANATLQTKFPDKYGRQNEHEISFVKTGEAGWALEKPALFREFSICEKSDTSCYSPELFTFSGGGKDVLDITESYYYREYRENYMGEIDDSPSNLDYNSIDFKNTNVDFMYYIDVDFKGTDAIMPYKGEFSEFEYAFTDAFTKRLDNIGRKFSYGKYECADGSNFCIGDGIVKRTYRGKDNFSANADCSFEEYGMEYFIVAKFYRDDIDNHTFNLVRDSLKNNFTSFVVSCSIKDDSTVTDVMYENGKLSYSVRSEEDAPEYGSRQYKTVTITE
ncbi:MAG: hypothetical protein LBL41_04525 [Bifidobacteriaceae bacterium]|jgi:hypothetical protein|nr:hypothetical protein [Bifidobacteriaceae bacterium]